MNISLEKILSRTSVRTYAGEKLKTEDEAALREAFKECAEGPFGGRPRFALVGPELAGSSAGKVGTYGLIRNAPAYILGVIARGEYAFEDFGYCLHGVVLAATARDLGTCWLAGFLDRSAVVRILEASRDEIVPAITPVGRTAARRGVVDSLIRGAAGSARRKPWEDLFFSETFDSPLPRGEDSWSQALECLRLAPSASNKQPWRVVRAGAGDEASLHLYLAEDRAYNHALGEIRMQNIDIGIAMRQFQAAADSLGLAGRWSRLPADPLNAAAPLFYRASWSLS